MGIDDPGEDDDVPPEFETDAWWRKNPEQGGDGNADEAV